MGRKFKDLVKEYQRILREHPETAEWDVVLEHDCDCYDSETDQFEYAIFNVCPCRIDEPEEDVFLLDSDLDCIPNALMLNHVNWTNYKLEN